MCDCVFSSPADLLANAILTQTPPSGLWALSGPGSSGKTTCCTQIVTRARETGQSVGGFVCPAVYKGGEKVGIDQVDIRTGERRRLGMRAGEVGERTIGCWLLDRSVLAWGNEIILGLKNEDLVVMDELGPLELEEGYGYQEGLRLLDESRYRAALVVVRPRLLPLVRCRWPQVQAVELGSV